MSEIAIRDMQSGFIETEQAQQALQMCLSVKAARKYERMGQITGDPGVGKTDLTTWLAKKLGGVRVECWCGMNDKILLQDIGKAFSERGEFVDTSGTSNSLMSRLFDVAGGQFIFVDEANHLHWSNLEKLRAISDQSGACVILCGTDLLRRKLHSSSTKIYTDQLRTRIGAKQIKIAPIKDDAAFAAYVIAPVFGQVSLRTARRFRQVAKGNWRMSLGLADACKRLMGNEGKDKLTKEIVNTAASWLAGHDENEI